MKKLVIVFILLIATSSVSIAREGGSKEEAVIRIVTFYSKNIQTHMVGVGADCNKMKEAEQEALMYANNWLSKNKNKVKVVSHSVAGNFVGAQGTRGFSSVTIFYVEK
ncbi:MAG: hypothetical protein US57_C0014G0026 [Candidatus Moranbacteria bacterium GW2011_GWC2_37_73]|nr:MAG: hypothetical protein UR95_C0002G0046 [Parcubacteria group bacterium GW2011_GWC1_36_108]KKP99907.1 MAG: hypothetical protein US09_C0029G0010 [Candidatus Moranbacteria bacterium GW2011_GWD1_36_198]KKQ01349.1 MAG: hypothetical protein US10_C0016G0019 [Candidatus Moranbacteria bacterium GW2011_GWD2_36_198]KKQ39403.1 MAG: hypothetical protein US57_C0014G0026 [Candidatus Moranbacteria bacterium GW2011_GWC2_37_73]HAS00060.1 hypothetical protein [Candidatus Moranbacteria bacterium]